MTSDGFAHLRIEYGDEPLRRDELPADPFELFRTWLAKAAAAGVSEPNGMTLATVDTDGQPHCRVVLLKELDGRGLTFFTNKHSDKGQQLAANARAAINFWWPAPRNRQVRLLGTVEHVEDAIADAYFRSRPRRAQICSAVSPQSRVVGGRDEIERLADELTARVGDGEVQRPAHWGGYRLLPTSIEFWQGRNGRLHDRFRYRVAAGSWRIEQLAP